MVLIWLMSNFSSWSIFSMVMNGLNANEKSV